MIAFGIAPGIRSLAYCALEWDGEGQALVLDADVMSKPRLLQDAPNPAILAKRFNFHRLILTTVWDRHEPTVLTIGPPADKKEPRQNALIASALMSEFGRLMGATVLHVTEVELAQVLLNGRSGRKTLKAALGSCVDDVPRERKAILAAGAAVYGLLDHAPHFLLQFKQ